MHKRLNQLVFRVIALVISCIGCLFSTGIFSEKNSMDFLLYYTNLSNYVCLIYWFVAVIHTYRVISKGEVEGNHSKFPRLKFYCMIAISVTFFIYNTLLGNPFSVDYWTSFSNVIMHCIAPLCFILDWILFEKRKTLKIYDPFLTLIFPYAYAAFILIRGALVDPSTTTTIYPYFFIDVNTYGYGGVAGWIVVLSCAFLLLAFLFYGWNHCRVLSNSVEKARNNSNCLPIK